MAAEISQRRKGDAFRALHEGSPFVIPNPWDAGSAKVLAALGFEALATTSSGFAFTLGRQDGDVTLDEVVEHTRALDAATSLPISVDLENGYGPDPADAARAYHRAAEAGAVGGSIEDYDPAGGIYGIEHAAERVAAAVEAARDLGFPFTLTARAENYFRDKPDLDDTIARLAGLRAGRARTCSTRPGFRRLEEIRAVRSATSKPLNVLAGPGVSVAEIVECRRPAHQRRRPPRLGRDQLDGRGRPAAARRGRDVLARRPGPDHRVDFGRSRIRRCVAGSRSALGAWVRCVTWSALGALRLERSGLRRNAVS